MLLSFCGLAQGRPAVPARLVLLPPFVTVSHTGEADLSRLLGLEAGGRDLNLLLVEPEPVLWPWVGFLPQAPGLRNMGTGAAGVGAGNAGRNLPGVSPPGCWGRGGRIRVQDSTD